MFPLLLATQNYAPILSKTRALTTMKNDHLKNLKRFRFSKDAESWCSVSLRQDVRFTALSRPSCESFQVRKQLHKATGTGVAFFRCQEGELTCNFPSRLGNARTFLISNVRLQVTPGTVHSDNKKIVRVKNSKVQSQSSQLMACN